MEKNSVSENLVEVYESSLFLPSDHSHEVIEICIKDANRSFGVWINCVL